jgi:CTP:molybdopterin cytidylyltransferase MocA
VDVAGVLLAAGAGRRLGVAKALVRDPGGTAWVLRQARTLGLGGCFPVLVVLGAQYQQSAAVLEGEPVTILRNRGWAEGMGSSLRLGLSAAPAGAVAATLAVVDTPGLTVEVVARINEHASPGALVRATYDAVPGHPVLIGREHWSGVCADAHDDVGAREYLRRNHPVEVECGDIGEGEDVDVAEALPPGSQLPGLDGVH